MNLVRVGVTQGQLKNHLGELKAGSGRRSEGEVTAGLRLYALRSFPRGTHCACPFREEHIY
jgi:hypothetical protein